MTRVSLAAGGGPSEDAAPIEAGEPVTQSDPRETGDRATRDFRANAASVAAAREWVSQVAAANGHAALDDTLRLLVTELATNAVRYADGIGYTIHVDTSAQLIVAVCDASTVLPVVHHPGDQKTTGRGLGIVESMSDSWGAYLQSGGKCVWFRLEPPGDVAPRA